MSDDYQDLLEYIAARTGALAIGLTLVLPNEEARCLTIVTKASDEPIPAILLRLSSTLIQAARRVFDKASAFEAS